MDVLDSPPGDPLKYVILLGLVLVALFICGNRVSKQANALLSAVINVYLCWRYPIKTNDGKRSLPTCSYQWPNGQGDVGKFLEGIENSDSWGKRYGGIYRLWSGMASEIVLTRPEDVKEVFKDSDRHIKALNNNSGWLMGEILGQCVGLVSQKDWQTLRTAIESPFLHTNIDTYIPLVEHRTRAHFESLHKIGKLARGLINPVDDLKLLPFWVVADILYGELSPEMEAQLQALIPLRESLFRRVISGGFPRFSWSKYLPTVTNKELTNFKTAWASFNDAAYERSSRNGSFAAIRSLYSSIESGRVSRDQVHQTLDEMLFANLDVTIGGISWNLLFLAADKESQSTLRNEILQKKNLSKENCESWKQYLLNSSSYLAASILESSRLKPLAAFSVPQAAPTKRCIDGFVIPAGTNFIVDSCALNIRNPYWGGDSSLYRPSRFLDRKSTDMRYNFWRFGFGPRQCMGKYMADLMIKALLVHLLENYELSLMEHGKDWDRNPETWITHPNTNVRCEQIKCSE